jgi:hypothetical protein
MKKVAVSRQFRIALKLHSAPAYRIAMEAGIHPSVLSRLLHGADYVRPNDLRVVAVGAVLGLNPADCFEALPSDGGETK